MTRDLTIDVWADVACPWCWIGERRLERALAERPQWRVTRRWHPFQLQPGIAPTGVPWEEFARAKFGGAERAAAMFAHVAAAGAEDGLEFRFDRMASAPNTTDAHRLVLLARRGGREWEMADALFAAYFRDGADLNDRERLVALASGAGVDADTARELLAGDELRDHVAAGQDEARLVGVQGVPFFVLDEKWAVSGAQPVDTWTGLLNRLEAQDGEP
jgi:predicted DsbA family dithiol-disulfide isomerase